MSKKLCYSNYTAWGYKIAELSLDEGTWKSVGEVTDHTEQLDYDLSTEGVLEMSSG